MLKVRNIPEVLRKKGVEGKLLKVILSNDVVFMGIFGSYVRGEQRRGSDLDVAIEYAPGVRKDLFALLDMEEELKKVFKRKVDLGILGSLHPAVRGEVEKEMAVVYEKR